MSNRDEDPRDQEAELREGCSDTESPESLRHTRVTNAHPPTQEETREDDETKEPGTDSKPAAESKKQQQQHEGETKGATSQVSQARHVELPPVVREAVKVSTTLESEGKNEVSAHHEGREDVTVPATLDVQKNVEQSRVAPRQMSSGKVNLVRVATAGETRSVRSGLVGRSAVSPATLGAVGGGGPGTQDRQHDTDVPRKLGEQLPQLPTQGKFFALTPREEYERYRLINRISPNYHGPVYMVEDIYVTCAHCGSPVDAVTRVPAGKLFFHPHCVHCKLCGSRNITGVFFQATHSTAVCAECAARGYVRNAIREVAMEYGMVVGAVRGPLNRAIQQHAAKARLGTGKSVINDKYIPPSLGLNPNHEYGNSSSKRRQSLVQRQQYYSQNDSNIICIPSMSGRMMIEQ
ncbi:hypothetical protein ERJ75_000380900 [Trypanosoma vivax]|uniref:LIM zinc-binding domain-containing protein n=1 Tax=Trypanosoma vivax (strain Y486) TaxID=1055687 RepID=G0TRW7_TRYVY|nr:hypothetical protein TRVL_03761 [Trypanosoma vivax]KAH8617369.1 hypothetical protein ERJ75_000380900 [Trypanosoma vivax]CCC46690.1 conserved hypothetical protein [Trypanosoma vivax Y486]